jgi:hypothetical protein
MRLPWPWLGVLVLATGCGLPLSAGVHDPGPVRPEQRQNGDIQVLPPGPRDDASPAEVVQDFFGAQSNPGDRHASARAFLAPGTAARWQDSGPVNVYEGPLTITPVPGDPASFRVTARIVGRIDIDGSFTRESGTITLGVQLRQGVHGRWQISTVPDGLLISSADRDPSFRPRNVYFLAPPPADGQPSTHLVPDRVFVPVSADAADALVRRLLAGPSRALRSSVLNAFPAGTTVRRVSSDASGLVTVDLSEQVAQAPQQVKVALSAQLVWTLRSLPSGFSKLRLLSDGREVRVPGSSGGPGLQDHDDWQAYAPDGLPSRAPLYYVSNRRLRQLDSARSDEPGTQQLVDVAAVSARSQAVAIVTGLGAAGELRIGKFGGPYAVRYRGGPLASPSWGSGERGLWFLSGTAVRFAPTTGAVVPVPVDGATGPITALQLSRDGARAAVIAGRGDAARLLVGPVSVGEGGPRIGPLVAIAPEVTGVRALSWDNPTGLVVLGNIAGVTAPVRVAVDGSDVDLISKVGLPVGSDLRSVAAAPGRPLVVGAVVSDTSRLFRDNGLVYSPEPDVVGYHPFYPD